MQWTFQNKLRQSQYIPSWEYSEAGRTHRDSPVFFLPGHSYMAVVSYEAKEALVWTGMAFSDL